VVQMRRPGVQVAGVLMAVFLLFLSGCGPGADAQSQTATRDPLSPTDQASVQLTEQQAKALEAACTKGEAVPGVSACPETVRKVAKEAKKSCTAQSKFCMTIAAGDGAPEAPLNGGTTTEAQALVTVSCPADPSVCSNVAPVLTEGKVLQQPIGSLASPGEETSTSSPETTEPVPTTETGPPTTEPVPTDSSPAS
jgi:hypothetical protein